MPKPSPRNTLPALTTTPCAPSSGGILHLRHNTTLAAQVDLEVHAVDLMLHDGVSDHNLPLPFVSPERRFEVDSAMATANFIRSRPDGKTWSDWRVQRV